MSSNIEIKAKVEDLESIEAVAQAISDTPCQILEQEDIFFNSPQGRLKLRLFPNGVGNLIYYERPDSNQAKQSDYIIYETNKPEGLKLLLEKTLGRKITVKKIRHLYISGQTRIHLDRIEGLGTFVEIEVVLHQGQIPQEGYRIAEELMKRLHIEDDQLVSGAYADLIEQKA